MATPLDFILADQSVAYSIESIEMLFYKKDFDNPDALIPSSEPLIENKDSILVVNKKQILIFYKTVKGLYPRLAGSLQDIEFDKAGSFHKVYGTSDDFSLASENFFIEWPVSDLSTGLAQDIKERVILSVPGTHELHPRITMQWILNNCALLGTIILSEVSSQ